MPTPPSTPLPAGLVNAAEPLPGIVTAGQPSTGQLEALARAGVEIVIDLRAPNEPRGFDEKDVVERLGLEYHNIPVDAALGDAEIDAVRALLRARADRTVLLHCKSANRVGAVMVPYLVLDERLSRDAALAVAQQIGLRSDDLTRVVLGVVDRAGGDA